MAFDLLLHVLSRKLDDGDAVSALGELHNFGAPNGTLLCGLLSCFPDGRFGGDRQQARVGTERGAGARDSSYECKRVVPAAHA